MKGDDIRDILQLEDDKTYQVNAESGIVEKEEVFGWTPTDIRVDPESGDICKLGGVPVTVY